MIISTRFKSIINQPMKQMSEIVNNTAPIHNEMEANRTIVQQFQHWLIKLAGHVYCYIMQQSQMAKKMLQYRTSDIHCFLEVKLFHKPIQEFSDGMLSSVPFNRTAVVGGAKNKQLGLQIFTKARKVYLNIYNHCTWKQKDTLETGPGDHALHWSWGDKQLVSR